MVMSVAQLNARDCLAKLSFGNHESPKKPSADEILLKINHGGRLYSVCSLSLFFCPSPQLQLKSFVMVGGGESENRKPFLAQLMPSAKGSHWIWSFLYRYQQRQPSVCFPFPLCSISVTFYVSLPFSAD
jgi:hypothetical protein